MGICPSEDSAMSIVRFSCSALSIGLVVGLYTIIGAHFYAFIYVVCPLMKARLGTWLGMTWLAVGLIILYNILFNHFWAMMIKPGTPKELRIIEKMRQEQKNRPYRKSLDTQLDEE